MSETLDKSCIYTICTALLISLLARPTLAKPNIVFIYTDDQAPFAVNAAGDSRFITPIIDRIFNEGAHRLTALSRHLCAVLVALGLTFKVATAANLESLTGSIQAMKNKLACLKTPLLSLSYFRPPAMPLGYSGNGISASKTIIIQLSLDTLLFAGIEWVVVLPKTQSWKLWTEK